MGITVWRSPSALDVCCPIPYVCAHTYFHQRSISSHFWAWVQKKGEKPHLNTIHFVTSQELIPFNWKQLTLTSWPDVRWYSAWKPTFTAPNYLASNTLPFVPAYPTSDQSFTTHNYSEKYLTFEMPRGIPWDDLTLFREKKINVEPIIQADTEPEPRDFNKDAYKIGKRALFGLVVCNWCHLRKNTNSSSEILDILDCLTDESCPHDFLPTMRVKFVIRYDV